MTTVKQLIGQTEHSSRFYSSSLRIHSSSSAALLPSRSIASSCHRSAGLQQQQSTFCLFLLCWSPEPTWGNQDVHLTERPGQVFSALLDKSRLPANDQKFLQKDDFVPLLYGTCLLLWWTQSLLDHLSIINPERRSRNSMFPNVLSSFQTSIRTT